MSTIYLIRHGQASFGHDNYDRLSDLGVRQARLLGAYFFRTGVSFDRVYSGTLERQIDTARAVLSESQSAMTADTLSVLPEFDEFASYSASMHRLAEMTAADPAFAEKVSAMLVNRQAFWEVSDSLLQQWRTDESLSPSGSAWQAFRTQVAAGLERVRAEGAPGQRAAVFTSGGTISAAMQRVLGLGDEHIIALARQTRNSSFSTFLCEDGRISLVSFNAVPHLELENDAALITVL